MSQNIEIYLNKINISPTSKLLDLIDNYCNLIIEANKQFNLVSSSNKEDIIINHILDSLSFNIINLSSYDLTPNFKLIDLGSGAGFPAIPIAILYPDSQITMLESTNKKATFLIQTAKALKLNNINVIPARIESIAHHTEHREQYHITTSRALAQINVLLEYSMPLLVNNGIMVAYKTENTLKEINQAQKCINLIGAEYKESLPYDIPQKDFKRTLIVFKKNKPTPIQYPRAIGVPAKKPIK